MSTVHSSEMNLESNFSLCDFRVAQNSSPKLDAVLLEPRQKSGQKCNHLPGHNKHTENLDCSFQKTLLDSKFLLKTCDSSCLKATESNPVVVSTFLPMPSDARNDYPLLVSSPWEPKQEVPLFSDVIKVKTEFEASPSSTTTFDCIVEIGTPDCVKQEPSTRPQIDRTNLNAVQGDQDGRSSLFNLAKSKDEICKLLLPKSERVSLFSEPLTGLKTEEVTNSMLISEEIKTEGNDINAWNKNDIKNENQNKPNANSKPTVVNGVNPDSRKIKTTRPETDKIKQLKLRKERFAMDNIPGFANKHGGAKTSTMQKPIKRKIVFSNEEENCLTKRSQKTIASDNLNKLRNLLDNTPGGSDQITDINILSLAGGDSGNDDKSWFSYEETNFARTNKLEATKRDILKAKRWNKQKQRVVKKMEKSAYSIREKICRNWEVATPSDKNVNLSVASYIRCRLSKLQLQTYQGRLEGEKISTLANVQSGQKRKLSIGNESISQRAKRCRLTCENNNDYEESEEISVLDFKMNSISKLEALEKNWNNKIDLEIETINTNYKRDLRQLQEQQSLENNNLCLKHSNQIHNAVMDNLARKHWKAFRQMQNNFLLKTQDIEKKRHIRLAQLRKDFQEVGIHIQTILDSSEILPNDTDFQKSPYISRRVSVDAAVRLVKEDKIYDSFYTQ